MLRLVAALALFCLVALAHAVQGVTRDQIRVGTIQDLSGPIALLGVPIRDGMQMRFDEANARGGVHGRRLRLIVEDSGYDPKKGVLAARKLIGSDRVFALLGTLGTPVVLATMPLALDQGLPHLFPFSPHPATFEPVSRLKFQIFTPYVDYMRTAVRYLVRANGYQRVGILYQDDDYGIEVLRGAELALQDGGLKLAEKTSYKRGATDFSAQIARLRAAGCELVVLGTVVRETVGAMQEARKVGWNVDMLVSSSGYSAQVHELGGKAVEGLYGVAASPIPYAEGANRELAAWIADYRRRFGAEPNVWSVQAYVAADLFVRAIERAGPRLDADTLARAFETMETRRDYFGSPNFRFTPSDHLGTRERRIARIRDGRWVMLTDYLK